MTTIVQREQNLAAAIAALVPGMPVAGALGSHDDTRRRGVPAHRSILIAAGGWEPASPGFGQPGGADVWTVRIVDSELRSPSLRRIGSSSLPDSGILRIAEILRAGLAGAVLLPHRSPLVARGGRLLAAGDPSAVWEETFLDYGPAPGLVPPAVATGVEPLGVLATPVSAATFDVSALDPQPVAGDAIVLRSADESRIEFIGAVLSIDGTVAATERSATSPFPAGSAVLRLVGAYRFPVTPSDRERVRVRNVRAHHDLLGGRHPVILAASRDTETTRFDPVAAEDAAAWIAWLETRRTAREFVHCDELGAVRAALPADDLRVSASRGMLRRLDVRFHLRPIADAADLEAIGA